MSISAKRLPIDPCLGDSVDSLIAVQTKKFGHNCSRSNLNENDVIKTDSVEGVKEGKSSLNFVGLDHRLENIANSKGLSLTSKMVRNGEDGTKIIRWMTPCIFKSEKMRVEYRIYNYIQQLGNNR